MTESQALEIEKKYRVQDINKIEQDLVGLGAVFGKQTQERDIYFNVSGRDSMTTKECLRIRSTNDKKEITYKPPTEKNNQGGHFAKKETNLLIKDVEIAQELLLNLGNSILVDFTKERKYYSLNDVTIALDVLNGAYFFIEIEVESEDEEDAIEKIIKVEELLGLSDDFIEDRPYRDIAMGL